MTIPMRLAGRSPLRISLKSLAESSSLLIDLVMTPSFELSRIWEITSARPNRPITTGMKLIPDMRSREPKVNRDTLVKLSIPTVDRRTPRVAPANPFASALPDTATMALRPKTARTVYSAGPNLRANRARTGAMMIRAMTPAMPPRVEPTVARLMALPASPFWAIGYPSREVMTEGGAPGMFRRIAE